MYFAKFFHAATGRKFNPTMIKKEVKSPLDKFHFLCVCVGLNLVFRYSVWGLIFDFAIFRAELRFDF